MRPLPNRNYFKYIVIAGVIVCIAITASILPALNRPLHIIGTTLTPVERVLYRLKIATSEFWHYLSTDTDSELEALSHENASLKTSLAEMSLVAQENNILRSQLNVQKKHERQLALAHIIGEKPGSFSRYLVLDIGINQGLRPGLPVIIDNALVGKIEKVSEHSAEMSLVTDPNSVYYSYLQNSKVKGLIKGTIGLGMLHLTEIPKNTTIIKGDNVFTTGQELTNFNNILIGAVTEVITNDQDTHATLLVKPTIDTQNLDSVFVVIN